MPSTTRPSAPSTPSWPTTSYRSPTPSPARAVNTSAEGAVAPRLRDHCVPPPRPERGTIGVEGSRMKRSAAPAVVQGPPPVLGQDTVEVITEILGYSDDAMGDLFAAGA